MERSGRGVLDGTFACLGRERKVSNMCPGFFYRIEKTNFVEKKEGTVKADLQRFLATQSLPDTTRLSLGRRRSVR